MFASFVDLLSTAASFYAPCQRDIIAVSAETGQIITDKTGAMAHLVNIPRRPRCVLTPPQMEQKVCPWLRDHHARRGAVYTQPMTSFFAHMYSVRKYSLSFFCF